ncbi:hypothetical protein [Flavobacterium wongokense]|nr:hypothetical protein [Flavobacterium sp. WG47]
METQGFLKSKAYKILLGMVVVFSAIMLAKFGYLFGQWLHQLIN